MKIFKHNNATFVCEFQGNRAGFKHKATFIIGESVIQTNSIQYYNRTWEKYNYQSVILKCIDCAIEEQKQGIKNNVLRLQGINALRSKMAKELFTEQCNNNETLKQFNGLRDYFKEL